MEYRKETDILIEMIEQATNTGLISNTEDIITQLREGKQSDNQYVLDLSAHSYILSQLERICNRAYDDRNVSTATGEALDQFGVLVGIARFPAKPGVVEVTMSLPLLESEDVVVPMGTPIILAEGMADYGSYVLSQTVTIPAGVESVTSMIENTVGGVNVPLPAGACIKTEGYNVTVTNEEAGTVGSNIEEDDDYRVRIIGGLSRNVRGSLACLENYLGNYTGITSYNIIPLFDGVGSLKLVCDTLESMTARIAEDVHTNCMIVTDPLPTVVLPDAVHLEELRLNVTMSSDTNLSNDELSALLIGQCRVFVEGGLNREGTRVKGLSIGADFAPAQLIRYLLSNFIEITNVYLERKENDVYVDFDQVYPVGETSVIELDDVVVVFE